MPLRPTLILIVLILASLGFYISLNKNPQLTNSDKKAATPNIEKRFPVVVAFGGSLTEGMGASSDNDFISLLGKRTEVPIINKGVGGDTTELALARIDDITSLKPDIVLVLLGGNDYLQQVPKPTTVRNLEEIITLLQKNGSQIILVGISTSNNNFDSEFKRISETYGTFYVPNIFDGIITNPDLMSDAVHPNNNGYKIIADRIYPKLVEALETL